MAKLRVRDRVSFAVFLFLLFWRLLLALVVVGSECNDACGAVGYLLAFSRWSYLALARRTWKGARL